MIKSMTGFGRAQETVNGMLVTVELKSVNHRYFEFNAKVPRAYGFLEEKLKSFIGTSVSRGKVECYVSIENLETGDVEVAVNVPLAGAYVQAMHELSETFKLRDELSATALTRFPEILTVRKVQLDEERVWEAVQQVTDKAVANFVEMRKVEGDKLREDLLMRADSILELVSFVETRSPQTVKDYNEKLKKRMEELLGNTQIEEQRLLTEAAIFADKIAVDEETVRLRSHIAQLRAFMDSVEPIGRKLDFLVQEINREANTIGSKAQDVEIAKTVIDIKAEVEKIREQVQNIE